MTRWLYRQLSDGSRLKTRYLTISLPAISGIQSSTGGGGGDRVV